jgi:epoxide hydrolase-like predicted phosphatase
MIKAVIFDCFGVLTTDGWLPFKRKKFGHDQDLERQATDLSRAMNGGYISVDDFLTQIAQLAGVSKAEVRRATEHTVTDDELLAYIRDELKPRYKIGLLSNAGSNWLKRLFAAEQIALFDEVALSCETGYQKPDPRAYATLAEKLGVQPEECVFTDDQAGYCSAAEAIGMRSVVFRDSTQFQRDFAALLRA